MSVLPEFNLMDMLFDRDGQSKIDDIKVDDKHSFDNFSSWDNNASIPGITGDFLDSILFNQNLNDLLPPADGEEFLSNTLASSAIGSSCSDSGVSSDQQMSPESFQDNSDDLDFQSIVKTEEDLSTMPPLTGYPQQTVICGQPDSPATFDTPIDIDGEEIEIKAEEVDDVEVDVEDLVEEVPQQTYTRPVVRVKPVSPVSRGTIHRSHFSPRSPPSTTRQILIPIKGRKSLKTIKIIKAVGGQVHQQQRVQHYEESRGSSSEDTGDEGEQPGPNPKNNLYPRLQLTEEERRLMLKEGISLPTHYPLTKQEERDLKRIRRKIRNKISAQDSRKRKKEYVDGLEDRVKQCTAENASLLKKMKALQSENQSLSAQLRRLQAVIARNGTNQTQPATCLMVLVLSLALIMAPNMRSTSRAVTNSDLGIPDTKSSPIVPGRTRTILESPQPAKPLEGGFQEIPIDGASESAMFEDEEMGDTKQGILSELAEMLQFKLTPSQLDHDYTSHRHRKRSRSYVVPPVDDKWPPPKRPHVEADPPPPPIRPSGRPTIRSFATVEPKNRTGVPSPSNIVEIELTSSDDGF